MKKAVECLLVLVIVFVGLTMSLAYAQEERKRPYPKAPFNLSRGELLYKQYCASCHGANGDGKGPAASALNPKPADFLNVTYMNARSRADHFKSIMNGKSGTAMPPWKGTLSEKDVWDIITYIEHLFHQAKKTNKGH